MDNEPNNEFEKDVEKKQEITDKNTIENNYEMKNTLCFISTFSLLFAIFLMILPGVVVALDNEIFRNVASRIYSVLIIIGVITATIARCAFPKSKGVKIIFAVYIAGVIIGSIILVLAFMCLVGFIYDCMSGNISCPG